MSIDIIVAALVAAAILALAVLAMRPARRLLFPYGRSFAREFVGETQRGVIYTRGRLDRIVGPGQVTLGPRQRLVRVAMAEQTIEVSPQELLTQDRFQVKLTATVVGRVSDVARFVTAAAGETHSLFGYPVLEVVNREAKLALRTIAAGRPLEAMLADRAALDEALMAALGAIEASYGFAVERAVVRDIILPAEVRRAYSEAERARLESLAALERARGEQAALRSLANAARMLKNSPELMNLRVLQTVEGLDPRSNVTVVLGEGTMTQLVSST